MNEFDDLVGKLNKAMTGKHVAVNKDRNPVYTGRKGMGEDQLIYVLGQYSKFPENIPYFLFAARDSARRAGWATVDTELTRNIGEELGTETEGATHYRMFVSGFDETLHLDISGIAAKSATNSFISSMMKSMKNSDTAYVAGAAYATESSAVPELGILVELTKDLAELRTGSRELSPRFQRFFDNHTDIWEVGHENKLRDACRDYITNQSQRAKFKGGFESVMKTMDYWWKGLYAETRKIT